jgi:hypothetical protein
VNPNSLIRLLSAPSTYGCFQHCCHSAGCWSGVCWHVPPSKSCWPIHHATPLFLPAGAQVGTWVSHYRGDEHNWGQRCMFTCVPCVPMLGRRIVSRGLYIYFAGRSARLAPPIDSAIGPPPHTSSICDYITGSDYIICQHKAYKAWELCLLFTRVVGLVPNPLPIII